MRSEVSRVVCALLQRPQCLLDTFGRCTEAVPFLNERGQMHPEHFLDQAFCVDDLQVCFDVQCCEADDNVDCEADDLVMKPMIKL